MNAIRHIRKNVFRLKQQEFAAIAGVQQSTVSRWERGEASPSLSEMAAIREAARGKRGWSDRLFFETPDMARAS
jgi:DNA-binding transcriptional regulator YiaG